MEYRKLGRSGLKVPVLSFGTATFGGTNEFFKNWGNTQVAEAHKLVELCLDAGINLFDTANGYSDGAAEEILGTVLVGKRQNVLLSTKAGFPQSAEPNDFGASRLHLIKACEQSLRRLKTDYIDIYHIHAFDMTTPIEETLRTLDDLVQSGKIRYIACSNFSGWQLMKSLAISEREGFARYVGHQAYYSLAGRELEWELMPLGLDQEVGTMVWSPLAGGALTGKISRTKPAPKTSRTGTLDFIPFEKEHLYTIVDALEEISKETGKSIPQIALNWVLQRPTISTVVVGARNEDQLRQNLGAVDWKLSATHMQKLNSASDMKPIYPYWHQFRAPMLTPEFLSYKK